MKILYVDIDSPNGHKNYNFNFIRCLSELCQLDVAFKKGYLTDFKGFSEYIQNVIEIPDKFYNQGDKKKKISTFTKIQHRINFYMAMKWINRLVKNSNYDLVIFGGVDIISFYFSTIGLKNRYIFVDHAIAYINTSKVKKACWRNINKYAEAIVMEDYIKDYLANDVEIKNKIWVVKHPLPKLKGSSFINTTKKRKIIFAPSNSNDDDFISYLIQNNDLLQKEYKIIIKSKKLKYENENIKVFNNRISEEEYYLLMSECEFVLLPYKSDYNYRVSGVFFEAISFNKKCIINGNNTMKYYAEKYPNSIMKFNNFEQFFDVLNRNDLNDKKELLIIQKEYSNENLISSIKRILC